MSYLNTQRPPVFCPGCSHENVVRGVDRSLQELNLKKDKVVIVTDIGCSGLFDTFFETHAFHGLHGRALTYATGLKMVRPELTVIVIMGDGGLGIGGAHVLASCRRNLDINLLVLNNFNYGMTGGQCSATTPDDAKTSSGFLTQLEAPLDICSVASAAGSPYVDRCVATGSDLSARISSAIQFDGFTLLDIWGICPGRHLKNNPMSLKKLAAEVEVLNESSGGRCGAGSSATQRPEYGKRYNQLAKELKPSPPLKVLEASVRPLVEERCEVLLLGSAGQYINTLGEILCYAALAGGLHAAQKNDYPITVLRGHSISEVVLQPDPVDYTGITSPSVVICLAKEGVAKRQSIFKALTKDVLVLKDSELEIPESPARIVELDASFTKLKKGQKGIAALAALAGMGLVINRQMLELGLKARYKGKIYDDSMEIVESFAS